MKKKSPDVLPPGRFIAIDAPITTFLPEVMVRGRFHKTGGPERGGYGLIVDDQGPEVHDGIAQSGNFIVFEVGDQGTVGIWQRRRGDWIEMLPWTPSPAVRAGNSTNDLAVRTDGKVATFNVNGNEVAQISTALHEGRVGIFVGGDGNEVVLDRYAIRYPIAGLTKPAWPPQPTPTPQRTATLSSADLVNRLDVAWAASNWAVVFGLLDELERIDPNAIDIPDERYAAHMAVGQALLKRGTKIQPRESSSKPGQSIQSAVKLFQR